MNSQSACALLYKLADINLTMGDMGPTRLDSAGKGDLQEMADDLADTEQRIIVELLTALLRRVPTDEEIQAATAI